MIHITKAELEVMDYLWSIAPKGDGFRGIINKLKRERARQTINTYLAKLIEKGYVYAEGTSGRKICYTKVRRKDLCLDGLGRVICW